MRTSSARRLLVAPAAALAAVALALAGCGGSSSSSGGLAAKAPIVVCGDLALSGAYAQIGETDNWGATAFFKHVNATGGILGHKVKYITINNQSSASQSEPISAGAPTRVVTPEADRSPNLPPVRPESRCRTRRLRARQKAARRRSR